MTAEEEKVVNKLRESFITSEKLRKHIELFINKGGMYCCYNGNLLLHGCMPVDEKGNFQEFSFEGNKYSGKKITRLF